MKLKLLSTTGTGKIDEWIRIARMENGNLRSGYHSRPFVNFWPTKSMMTEDRGGIDNGADGDYYYYYYSCFYYKYSWGTRPHALEPISELISLVAGQDGS